jgi:uncharacterized protein (DUF433 family)
MASLTFEPLVVPLRVDEYDAIRVGGTRVLLDLVIDEFQKGATPELIVDCYDALSLADVYVVLGYYLQNPEPIDEYLRRREEEATAVRRHIEAVQPPRPNLRAMLLARLKAREKGHAAADQRP